MLRGGTRMMRGSPSGRRSCIRLTVAKISRAFPFAWIRRLRRSSAAACKGRRAGAKAEPLLLDSGSPVRCHYDAHGSPGGRTGRSLGPPGDTRDNPCRRQGDQVVAPSSTGRRLLVEDDDGVSGATPTLSRPIAWAAGVGGPSSSRRARMPGSTSRWGEGFARPRSGRSRDVRPRPPVCAVCLWLRSSARARTARSRVVRSGSELHVGGCGYARLLWARSGGEVRRSRVWRSRGLTSWRTVGHSHAGRRTLVGGRRPPCRR
jgi:hypothetical protein